MCYPIGFCQFFPNLINFLCILERTDGERGREIIIAAVSGSFCCLLHEETIAAKTSLSALRNLFQPFCHLVKNFRLIGTFFNMNRMFKLHLSDQSFNLLHSFAVFFFQRDVWIIKKYRDLKIFRKIFQHITAARSTTTVQQ